MLAVLIMLTLSCRNEIFDCQIAKVRFAELPLKDVEKQWDLILEWLEQDYQLPELTRELLSIPKYSDYWPLFTTQDEWNIFKYVMDVLGPLRYWTLWILKRYTVTLHCVITVTNDMLDHMDGIMRALGKKKTQLKEDLYFAMKFARQKLSKHYGEVTPWTGMLLITAHILDLFQKLRLFRKWD